MDALKRAEQAKERNSAAASAAELSLEPLPDQPAPPAATTPEPPVADSPAPPAGAEPLPRLPRLEDLDEQFIAIARQPSSQMRGRAAGGGPRPADMAPPAGRLPPAQSSAQTRTEPPASSPEQAAIRNAFAVKEAAGNRRTGWLAIAALTLLAVAAIGIYFWMQLRPTPGIGISAPPLASTSISATSVAPLAPAVPERPATPPATSTPGASSSSAASAAEPPARPSARAGAASKVSRGDTPPPTPAVAPPPDAGPAQAPIRFARSADRPAPSSVAAEGYAALQAGNLAAARAAYERSLRAEPRNIDAMLGLAAIALREGRAEDAETGYLRILEVDPRNAEAHAALAGLRGGSDPVRAESQIKSLLALQPDMPALHFALGNLYARQHRWSEAQQAYFRATTADGDNPDYLFNLAVSLDQLHQPRLAADYYRRALKAAETRQAAFDRAMATHRLGELKQP